MNPKAFAAAAAVALVALAGSGRGQDPEPTDEKKPRGMLGALSGSEDPSAERRQGRPEPSTTQPGADAPRRADTHAVRSVPDPERLAGHIRRLEGVRYADVEPVSGLDDARQRINRLRRRADALRRRADQRTVRAMNDVAGHTEQVRSKWQEVVNALNDGKKRTPMDWEALFSRVRGMPTGPETPSALDAARAAAEGAAKAADEALGMPADDDLGSDDDDGEDTEEAPADGEADPLKPPKEPKTEKEIVPPDLSNLAEAIKNQEKPVSMLPITWAKLLDEFGRDVAELDAAVAAARKGVKDRREAEFAPVATALRSAQRTYSQLDELGDEPGEAFRRHMAWRIHQAELAQMRLAHGDLSALANERRGQQSDREPLIEMHPLDPAKTLEQLARLLHVDGMPGSPTPDQFDSLTAEGLPDLYPPGSNTIVDDKVHYGNLVKANIDRHQRSLRDIHRRMANMEDILAQEDRAALRRLWSDMLHEDRLAGRADHPINRAKRRVAVKEKYRDLLASRADRVEKRKGELEKEAAAVVNRLEAEYKRRDAMLEPEAGPGEEAETEGDAPD